MEIKNYLRAVHTLGPSHDGEGQIADAQLLNASDFISNLQFVIHSVLKPGTSIGYHTHGDDEEIYIILSGRGQMTVDGETREVGPGDVILNRPRGSHGLSNLSSADLEILVFEVKC